MFEATKRRIAHFLIRRKYLRKNTKPISYTNIIRKAQSLFIIMPKQDTDFYHSMCILKYYQQNKKIITLFLPEYKYNLIPEKEKFKFISYHPKQITRFYLPDKKLTDRLAAKEFDVVMDLNRSEDVFYSAVTNIIKSEIRVSFAKNHSDSYYNLQLANKQSDPETSYSNFLNYLKMF